MRSMRIKKISLAYLLVLGSFLFFCSSAWSSSSNRLDSLKIINYNVWHGLTLDGFKTPSIEPEGEKEKRVLWQIELLKREKPDLIFMQEVNPVASKFFKFGSSLTKRYAEALNMESISLIDNCGVKVGGNGFPKIYSGLVILARSELKLKKIKGKKLGTFFSSGFCNQIFSVQWKESRYALFGKIEVNGKEVYVVNTHLHHSLNAETALAYVNEAKNGGGVSDEVFTSIEAQIYAGEERRVKEVTLLSKMIKNMRAKNPSLEFILAGDFNDTASSETITIVRDLGFESVNKKRKFFTWNPKLNKAKQIKKFIFPYKLKGATEEEKEILEVAFSDADNVRREIDFIFLSSGLSSQSEIVETSLFGTEKSNEDTYGSDHFGVVTEINLIN